MPKATAATTYDFPALPALPSDVITLCIKAPLHRRPSRSSRWLRSTYRRAQRISRRLLSNPSCSEQVVTRQWERIHTCFLVHLLPRLRKVRDVHQRGDGDAARQAHSYSVFTDKPLVLPLVARARFGLEIDLKAHRATFVLFHSHPIHLPTYSSCLESTPALVVVALEVFYLFRHPRRQWVNSAHRIGVFLMPAVVVFLKL